MPFDGAEYAKSETLRKLEQVAELLATEDRWCKGINQTVDGRRCIVGAMQAVEAELVLEPVILTAIREVTGRRCRRIERFNDRPTTTHDLVLAVLRQAHTDVVVGRLPNQRGGSAWRSSWQRMKAWVCGKEGCFAS
ncbi:MAG TPA: hypothetical protein VFA50_04745 [Stellaceae bacterium]|nr:hypothetical protein [Stellaceae bacterium]